MYLPKFSDYSFRTLIALGNNPDICFTVDTLADSLNLSNHHIKKIVYKLSTESIFYQLKEEMVV